MLKCTNLNFKLIAGGGELDGQVLDLAALAIHERIKARKVSPIQVQLLIPVGFTPLNNSLSILFCLTSLYKTFQGATTLSITTIYITTFSITRNKTRHSALWQSVIVMSVIS
jgi:hypothetical protein